MRKDLLHTEEFKIRLTEDDAAFLVNLARSRDIPPAVLARTFIKQFLLLNKTPIVNAANGIGRPDEGREGLTDGHYSTAR